MGVTIRHDKKGGEKMAGGIKLSVKAIRVNCGMLSKDVAEALGLSINAYSRKENNRGRFYADEIAQLSNLFNVPYENFFEAECRNKTRNDE